MSQQSTRVIRIPYRGDVAIRHLVSATAEFDNTPGVPPNPEARAEHLEECLGRLLELLDLSDDQLRYVVGAGL